MERIRANLILEGVIEATPEERDKAWEAILSGPLGLEIAHFWGDAALREAKRLPKDPEEPKLG